MNIPLPKSIHLEDVHVVSNRDHANDHANGKRPHKNPHDIRGSVFIEYTPDAQEIIRNMVGLFFVFGCLFVFMAFSCFVRFTTVNVLFPTHSYLYRLHIFLRSWFSRNLSIR